METFTSKSSFVVEHFSSAKDMTASRFKEFQKYLIEAWGVGNTIEAVDQRLTGAFQMVMANENEKALAELHNLRIAINYTFQKMSIKSYALAVCIVKAGGLTITDYTESGLSRYVKLIEDNLTQEEVELLVDSIKKKLKVN